MPADRDLLFGQIAIDLKFCTEEQVEKCLDLQGASPQPVALGRHLVDEGFLTEDQHSKVLEVQRRRMAQVDPVVKATKEDVLFGRLALRECLLTQEQLNEGLRLQGRPGEKRTLGEILVSLGHLRPHQVKVLLARQSKKIMSCANCRASFTVHTITRGKPIDCPRCKVPMQEGKPGDSVRTDGELKSESARAIHVQAVPGQAPVQRATPCRICDHPFSGDVGSDGRAECLSCHVRFVP